MSHLAGGIDVIARESADADLVFLGLASSAPGSELADAERIAALTDRLPTSAPMGCLVA